MCEIVSSRPLIVARDLGFSYASATTPALDAVSFTIKESEFVLLTGPSGCGKTTLCRCLNALIPNFHPGELHGELLIDGVSTGSQLTGELSKKVGYVFQNPENQLFALSVEKDIAFGPENLGLSREEIRERVDEAMRITGTEKLKDLAPYELSGGQQQRVALAGVLAMRPSVIVLDEPTSFLDPHTAQDVMEATDELRRKLRIAIIVVEHRLDLVSRYANRIMVMDKGRLVADGPLEDVLDQKFHLLHGLGVGVPRVSLLWTLLRNDSLVSGRVPTNVEAAAESLGRLLKE
ncbi:MAG TPA: ABC transporter ATP-binding protein [Candidatus Bathyarchaeia archaeon]|nr:ABC transporter ATP-binding protein [Candidatus Bathyarchaeia archaeon]